MASGGSAVPNVDESSLGAPEGVAHECDAERARLPGAGAGRDNPQQVAGAQQKLCAERGDRGSRGRAGSRRVAVAQMTAVGDVEKNYATCKLLVEQAAAAGAALLCLPECFSIIGARDGEAAAVAEPLDGPIMKKYCQLAREFSIWLSLGGFQEAGGPEAGRRFFNTHVLVDDAGKIQAAYRKIHLFDVDVPGGPVLKESNSTLPGSAVVSAVSPVGKLGLTVCYDLRFPELYQRLRFDHDCDVLLIPAAFTQKTGEAHWEILLRARAIECQCYVIAAAQAGRHNERRDSYGHALVVDPWGKVAARCSGIATVDIDMDLIASTRQRMPVGQHRRLTTYGAFPTG
ncbi:hypothetical protein CLOM_g9178 [Closterium sp. NIES-68]|nr:hypothetical protein CLOM_g9178 [Closterium sp. NIES-68]GJP77583.1 hypothetical protein CLOP_g7950 [Closterium sp. NIES-67]GJP86769.1 hypothetical protein CLOP_g16752 [Closterium sp. NIES-67]